LFCRREGEKQAALRTRNFSSKRGFDGDRRKNARNFSTRILEHDVAIFIDAGYSEFGRERIVEGAPKNNVLKKRG
jgi:hypothetical protein